MTAGTRPYEIREDVELSAGLACVLDAIHDLFFVGCRSTGDAVPNAELCDASLRLVRLLTYGRVTATPDAFALRALLCFYASRRAARTREDGSVLPVSQEPVSRWDRLLLAEAFWCRELARAGATQSRFHLEAEIAASHARALAGKEACADLR